MDLQGQPISSGSKSTKVTNDSEAYRNPISEPSGPVANDSLAAESATHGGTFAQNRGAEPLGVSGSNSTFNNTDTSGATKLPPASVGTQREDINRQERYPEALGGQGDFPGPHAGQAGYVGGSTAMKEEFSAAHGGSGQQKSQYNGGQAPSYVSDLTGDLGHSKPKGKNLQEGGFDSDPKYNASFNSEIGSRHDPGRVGENDMQRRVAESGPDAGGGPRQKGVDNQHLYQHLAREESA